MNPKLTLICFLLILVAGCSDSNTPTPTRSAASPEVVLPITLHGVVIDGDVSGGTLYFFSAGDIQSALAAASTAEDRAATLAASGPLAILALGAGEEYRLDLDAGLAGSAVFVVFDNTGATDLTFGGTPFNMESVVVLGNAGNGHRVNVTPYTSVIAAQVRQQLPLDATGVADAIDDARGNVVATLGTDSFGNQLLQLNTDPIAHVDVQLVSDSATVLGAVVRGAVLGTGLDAAQVFEALAMDAMDGSIDGQSPGNTDEAVVAVASLLNVGGKLDDTVVAGSCATTASLLMRACEVDIMDDFLESAAVCQDAEGDELDECLADAREERSEVLDECGVLFESRSTLCASLQDSVYEPDFGEDFAGNFVDPRNIGTSVEPNAYLPLVQGNVWEYESNFIDEDDGEEKTETIVITVTDETKLIQGIRCLTVNDRVIEDGELIEDTDDWFAQDVDGNVWYCGEVSKNYELFAGDEPEAPELTDLDGSWKAGRDGAKAGIIMPANPIIGTVLRTEVLYGEAEDVIEVISLSGDEETEVADCNGECLVMADTTPLDSEAFEHKFYKPGVGFLVEVDLTTGSRANLVRFSTADGTSGGEAMSLSAAKLLIEHNATDADTGFQGFADGAPWDQLTIVNAATEVVLQAWAGGGLAGFGLTEFFFETSEPPNDEVPIDDVLERLNEGDYDFSTDLAAGGNAARETEFSHDIPVGAELISPEDEQGDIDPLATVITWSAVTTDIDDDEIDIVGYQVIVEQEAPPYDTDGFARPVLSVHLPASATSVSIPPAFMQDDACYAYEVLAIETTGNQTLTTAAFETGNGCGAVDESEDPSGLKAARLLIEHNATDEDTGFQGFADGDPWNELTITSPDDEDIVTVVPGAGLLGFGLTELFFETSEPPNAEVSIGSVLARLPEGTYTFAAGHVDAEESELTAVFTHTIPAGPVLVSPEQEAEDVDTNDTTVVWEPVFTDLDGDPVTIVGYQVIVEEDLEEVAFPSGFARPVFSVFLPPGVTSVGIPPEFMRPDTDYAFEVLAIEASGNQTLSVGEFTTGE